MSDDIKSYLDAVSAQIRWKRARRTLVSELWAHIEDRRNELTASGMTEDEASGLAVREMGDPVSVGCELDRLHRPKPELPIMLLTLVLLALGSQNYMALAVGAVCAAATYFIDYTALAMRPIVFFAAVTAAVPLLAAVAAQYYYLKYLFLLYPLALAALIYGLRGWRTAGALTAGAGFLLQVALSSRFMYSYALPYVVLGGAGLLIYASARSLYGPGRRVLCALTTLGTLALAALLVYFTLAVFYPGLLDILTNIWTPGYIEQNPEYLYGFVTGRVRDIVSKASFGGGGEVLAEVGQILETPNYLLTRQLALRGWKSFILMVLPSVLLAARGFYLCSKQKSALGGLVSAAVLLTYAAQTALYIMNNLGLYMNAFPMPFVSYGGSSLALNMALVGLLLSVFRSDSIVRDAPARSGPRFERSDGTLKISLK